MRTIAWARKMSTKPRRMNRMLGFHCTTCVAWNTSSLMMSGRNIVFNARATAPFAPATPASRVYDIMFDRREMTPAALAVGGAGLVLHCVHDAPRGPGADVVSAGRDGQQEQVNHAHVLQLVDR